MNKCKEAVNKFAASPFFTLSRKPLEFIEKSKIFRYIFVFVCGAIAIVTLLQPVFIFFRILISGYFNFGVWHILGFLFVWAAIAAACWLGFHLWWSRIKKAEEIFSREFFVAPFFAEIIRTLGEWLGILLSVIGLAGGLFSLIFFRGHASSALEVFVSRSPVLYGLFSGLEFVPFLGGILGGFFDLPIIFGLVSGILIVLVTRLIAESVRVLAVIANNSKLLNTIAYNTKGKPQG